MLSKRHFQAAAAQVDAIRAGKWAHEPPDWAGENAIFYITDTGYGDEQVNYTRAVQTAEAYILLFSQYNPLFDVGRFLYACGLGPKPQPKKRRTS